MNIQTLNIVKEIELSILGVLWETPMHGYQLYKQISKFSEGGVIWRIKIANLYAILKKLEHAGYIESEFDSGGNRHAKNTYRLTECGKQAFQEWIKRPVLRGRDFRIIFLMKLFFAKQHGVKIAADLVKNQKRTCEYWLKKLNSHTVNVTQNDFQHFVTQFRLTQVKSFIDWLDWSEKQILELGEK